MNRINKTQNSLNSVWNDLDIVSEKLDAALTKLEAMVDLPKDLQSEIDRFDVSAILSLKNQVEMLLEKKYDLTPWTICNELNK